MVHVRTKGVITHTHTHTHTHTKLNTHMHRETDRSKSGRAREITILIHEIGNGLEIHVQNFVVSPKIFWKDYSDTTLN